MQDYRVETFLAVCRTLNYTRAAEELNITQPAVSQHIAFLEKEYGAKLFSYANRKLSLTRQASWCGARWPPWRTTTGSCVKAWPRANARRRFRCPSA